MHQTVPASLALTCPSSDNFGLMLCLCVVLHVHAEGGGLHVWAPVQLWATIIDTTSFRCCHCCCCCCCCPQVLTHRLDRAAHSLQEMTEYALPDNVLAVAWVGSNMVAGGGGEC
jgi:hypothetical protein